jgi:sulfite reductase (NADPH) flavoprotein alpha-component
VDATLTYPAGTAPELDALRRLVDSLLHTDPHARRAANPAGDLLDAEQWQLVERLGASLDREQAQWVSGYFAGVATAARERAQRAPVTQRDAAPVTHTASAPAAPARSVTILYGSETGNGAAVAARLAEAAQAQGLAATVVDMRDYKTRKLKDERALLIVTATHGEGDPPQPARPFFEFIEGRKAPRLPELRYAVLALGDLSYEHFCAAGRRLDERLAALGGERLLARVDCDVDYQEAAATWTRDVLAALAAQASTAAPAPAAHAFGASIGGAAGAATAPASTLAGVLALRQPGRAPLGPAAGEIRVPPGYGRERPFPATVVENLVLAGRGSSKETRHLELSLEGSGLEYAPGDALGIVSRNDPAVVAALLRALDLPASASVTVDGRATTLGAALTEAFEITLATPRFLDHWAALAGNSALFSDLDAAARRTFLRSHHIVDVVRLHPVRGLDPQQFVRGLRPLQPRLYSIASSHSATPGEAHLTVAPVRYMMQGERRAGVVSGALADRVDIDSTLPVYIHHNPHFRLPADQRPIIMIGAGTGVAPYRAFMQEREVQGGGGPSWLIFGERNFRTDFLYQTEWQGWLRDGVLSRMDVAFSRDRAQKVYVQHRLRERGSDVFQWLEDGANVYVCGDAAHLAPDVHEALVDVVTNRGGLDREAASEYLSGLQRDGRYQRDVY